MAYTVVEGGQSIKNLGKKTLWATTGMYFFFLKEKKNFKLHSCMVCMCEWVCTYVNATVFIQRLGHLWD